MRVILCRSVLFLLPVVLFSCATIPIKPLSQSDIPELVGKWEGSLNARGGDELSVQSTELKIFNEKLEGKWIIHGTSQGTVGHPFVGSIEDGRLVFYWEKDRWVKLSLAKSNGKMQLKGPFQWRQWQGTLSFQKVK